MNSRVEVAKFEPKPTFKNTINEIKYNYMKSITSDSINVSAIPQFDDNSEQLSMNSRVEVAKFEPELTF